MKENAGEKCQTSAWEKAWQNNYGRQEYSEMNIPAEYVPGYGKEFEKELKELKAMLRWHEM